MSGHSHPSYGKVLLWLWILFAISFAGPFLEIRVVTMVTAFGVATVKAFLVLKYFMHVNVEKKYVSYLLATAIAFLALFFAGVAPDVLNHEGQNWENLAAKAEVERRELAHAASGGEDAHH